MLGLILSFVVVTALSSGSIYNPNTEICCDGQIHPNTNPDSVQCCGTELYNRVTSRCCGGKIVDLPDDDNGTVKWFCCGETWYHPEDYMKEDKGCCKNKEYYLATQQCDRTTFELTDKPVEKDLALCGVQIYNKSSQICQMPHHTADMTFAICDKSSNAGHSGCCGNSSYDPTKQICCIDTIHPRIDASLKINICCGRNIYPSAITAYLSRDNHMSSRLMCCNDTVMEKTYLSEECCGSTPYDSADSLCCSGVIVENVPFGHQCCGNSTYNSKTSTCCKGNIYPLSYSEQSCCYNPEMPQDIINVKSELRAMNVKSCQHMCISGNELFEYKPMGSRH